MMVINDSVIPTVAMMGQGLTELFSAAVNTVRKEMCPLPQRASDHICRSLQPLSEALNQPEIHTAFSVPHDLLLMQLAGGDRYFHDEVAEHFPALLPRVEQLRAQASAQSGTAGHADSTGALDGGGSSRATNRASSPTIRPSWWVSMSTRGRRGRSPPR